jgi:cell division protein FtsL
MNGKQIKTIFILILFCFIFYFIVTGQINNNLTNLRIQITDLKENYDILENKSNSMKAEIKSLLSIKNLEKIAEEKNFNKPTKEQKIVLKNDKDKKE